MAREMRNSGLSAIGAVPSDWHVTRGKNVLMSLNRPVKDDDGVITCFRDGEVTLRSNRRTDGFTISLKEIGYQGIEPGDLVVHGMDGFAGAIGISDSRGKASPVLNVLDSSQDKRYLMYYLRALAYREVYLALADGIRVRSCNLSWKKISELPILLPTIEEQRHIADYLDAKCNEVDAAISHAEALISEYELYEQALITHTVNSGINVDAEMVPSGNAFIGNKPTSWPLVRFKHIAFFLNGDRSARYPSGDDIVSDGIPFVTSAELNGRHLSRTFSKHITQMKYDSLGGVRLHIDDVVYCLRGSVGKCALNVQEDEGTVASSLTVARPKGCNPSWLSYALASSSTLNQAVATAIGATSQNLAAKMLAQAQVPLPNLDEQLLIANQLDSKCEAIDQAIAQKRSIIDDLKAYKQSLIYEVVTGKKEV